MPLQPTISHEAKVLEITSAAMQATMQGKAHVFVNYVSHINGLTAYAEPIDTDFSDYEREFVNLFGRYQETIYLDSSDAAERLEAILAKIKAL